MTLELELPVLPADKDSPDYFEQLEQGYERITEIMEKATKETKKLLDDFKEDLFSGEKVKTLSERTIVWDDGKGNVKRKHEEKEVEFNPKDLPGIIAESGKKYKGKFSEREKLNNAIGKRSDEFLIAILGLTELRPIVEEGHGIVALYVSNREKVSLATIDFNYPFYSGLFPVINLTPNSFDDASTLELIKNADAGKDIYLAVNPSEFVELEWVMKYARGKIWQKFKEKNPEDVEAIEELSKAIASGKRKMFENISDIPEKRLSGFFVPSEEKYRDKCPNCEKKDRCPMYRMAQKRYDKLDS